MCPCKKHGLKNLVALFTPVHFRYKLFGGFKDEVACYATCGYYREGKDEQELRDDLQMMVEQGGQSCRFQTIRASPASLAIGCISGIGPTPRA